MATSPDLGLPYIAASQAQPEVTHNDALNLIQALLNGVISVGLDTPAVSPTIGDSYVIGTSPTGAWAGRANVVTIWNGTAWDFIPGETSAGTPITMGARQEGLRVWSKADDSLYIWSGSAWAALASGGSQTGIASSLASGNHYLSNPMSTGWTTTTLLTTVLWVQMVYVDSEITATGLAINCSSAAAGSTADIAIYEFLGAGNPGTALGVCSIDTSTTGVKTASFGGGNITLAPGVYFMTLRAVTDSPTLWIGQSNAEGSGTDIMLITNDGMLNGISSTSERSSVSVADAELPGGSWSSGMDLTSLTLSASNVVYRNNLYRVALIKA